MKNFVVNGKRIDFEELGKNTTLETQDVQRATEICGCEIHAYEAGLQPELVRLNGDLQNEKNHAHALHDRLYDRAVPVDDAAMLARSARLKFLTALALIVLIATFGSNITTFLVFLGFSLPMVLLSAGGMTVIPLVIGHLAYEKLVAGNKALQAAAVAALLALCAAGGFELFQARQIMMEKATVTTQASSSYVDDDDAKAQTVPDATPQGGSETEIRHRFGTSTLLFALAAELGLGFLFGQITHLRNDDDYTAWTRLNKSEEIRLAIEKKIAELMASVEIAKRLCMAGILRAQTVLNRRRPPYHRVLTVVLFALLLFGQLAAHAQKIEHMEGYLIDTSGSVSKGGKGDLFRGYLLATRKLLLTEPPNSRVWVSTIDVDSFGGVQEILKGWTPDSRGVFTDDLDRARRELAKRFETKSALIAPTASGTDIFGALWRIKAGFESEPKRTQDSTKTIWIFSDMMNETQEFPMPALLSMGPEELLERAKGSGLVVPLSGYTIYVYGASINGLTPKEWGTVKEFWSAYFSAAGAMVQTYSLESGVQR